MSRLSYILFIVLILNCSSKSPCDELIDIVESKSRISKTYDSPNSEAISWVEFHQVDYKFIPYNFAVVCFNNNKWGKCSEYIYQVNMLTEIYYSSTYRVSAGRAYWAYIEPHRGDLNCEYAVKLFK